MTAIEAMLAEEDRRRRSAIKALQTSRWDRPGDVWTPHEEMLREAVLELWTTLTLIIEIEKMRDRRPWWRRQIARWSR